MQKDLKASPLVKGLSHYAQITSRVAVVTVSVVALFGVPAYFLDHKLDTYPWIFVSALLVSMPVSLYMTYKVILDLLKRNSSGPEGSAKQ